MPQRVAYTYGFVCFTATNLEVIFLFNMAELNLPGKSTHVEIRGFGAISDFYGLPSFPFLYSVSGDLLLPTNKHTEEKVLVSIRITLYIYFKNSRKILSGSIAFLEKGK